MRASHFIISGDGPLKSKFMTQYKGMPNIHFLPLQPVAGLAPRRFLRHKLPDRTAFVVGVHLPLLSLP